MDASARLHSIEQTQFCNPTDEDTVVDASKSTSPKLNPTPTIITHSPVINTPISRRRTTCCGCINNIYRYLFPRQLPDKIEIKVVDTAGKATAQPSASSVVERLETLEKEQLSALEKGTTSSKDDGNYLEKNWKGQMTSDGALNNIFFNYFLPKSWLFRINE